MDLLSWETKTGEANPRREGGGKSDRNERYAESTEGKPSADRLHSGVHVCRFALSVTSSNV